MRRKTRRPGWNFVARQDSVQRLRVRAGALPGKGLTGEPELDTRFPGKEAHRYEDGRQAHAASTSRSFLCLDGDPNRTSFELLLNSNVDRWLSDAGTADARRTVSGRLADA